MNVIINRILFWIAPFIIILFLIIYLNDVTLKNFYTEIGFLGWLSAFTLIITCYDLIRRLKKLQIRKVILENPDLKEIPLGLNKPKRLNFMDSRVSINDNSIDVFFNNSVVFHANKKNEEIEVKKFFGRKIISFNDIDFLFIDYNKFRKDTLIDALFSNGSLDKKVWSNTVSAILKSGEKVKLFAAQLEITNHDELFDEITSGKTTTNDYLKNGEALIQLFSQFMNKKYLIIDNRL
ncbi:hypothetical protein [Galbibacter mesophilus]|uniref:hypothetical protein n=1 Tax=Galbibacter mesophilus TaxID=379069 RepID=UPI00191CD1A0|nr:hypothetical protein [Galbibacter mesophilus]MCM5663375.1 hypothetical protein [Galbibacter mesophilus]